MGVLTTMSAYMKEIEKPAGVGLDIPAMLGFPDVGRATPTLPVACLFFQDDDYAGPQQAHRLGQVQPVGRQVTGSLVVIANTEQELLRLVDTLRDVKVSLSAVTAGGEVWTVRYSPTRRTTVELPERQLQYAVETLLTFTTRKEN